MGTAKSTAHHYRLLVTHLFVGLLLACMPITFFSVTANATDDQRDHSNANKERGENQASDSRTEHVKQKASNEQAAKGTKLDAKKLTACKKHETHIGTIMNDITTSSTNQYQVFEKIANRTEQFVNDKSLTVPGYHELVSSVHTAHDTAKASSEELHSLGVSWSCNSESPKAVLEEFKSAKQQEISDMKAYKNAIRALLVAVKTSIHDQKTNGGV